MEPPRDNDPRHRRANAAGPCRSPRQLSCRQHHPRPRTCDGMCRVGLRAATLAGSGELQSDDPGHRGRHGVSQPGRHPRPGKGRRDVRHAPAAARCHHPARPAAHGVPGDRGRRSRRRHHRCHPGGDLRRHGVDGASARRRAPARAVDRRGHLDLRRLGSDCDQHRGAGAGRGCRLCSGLRHRVRLGGHAALSVAARPAAARSACLRPVERRLDPRDRPGGRRGIPGRPERRRDPRPSPS